MPFQLILYNWPYADQVAIGGKGGIIYRYPFMYRVDIDPTGSIVAQGNTQQFYATGTFTGSLGSGTLPLDGWSGVSWSSSNPSLVTVDQSGLATAVSGPGVAYVTASVLGDVVGTAYVSSTI